MESVVVTGESWIIKPNTISNKQTGASGVLGSAIYKAFETSGYLLLGLANSRAREGLRKLDLTDQTAVEDTLREVKPKCQFFRKKYSPIPGYLRLVLIRCHSLCCGASP